MANDQSADDALEEGRQDESIKRLTNPDPPLAEDNNTPAAPADDQQIIPPDHPITDSNIDKSELYDEGEGGAASVEDVDDNIIPNKDKESDQYQR